MLPPASSRFQLAQLIRRPRGAGRAGTSCFRLLLGTQTQSPALRGSTNTKITLALRMAALLPEKASWATAGCCCQAVQLLVLGACLYNQCSMEQQRWPVV